MSPNGQFAFWQSVERREGELAAKLTVNYRGHTSILPLQVMNKPFSARSNAVFDVLIRVDKGVIKIIKVKSIPMMDLLQMMSRGLV